MYNYYILHIYPAKITEQIQFIASRSSSFDDNHNDNHNDIVIEAEEQKQNDAAQKLKEIEEHIVVLKLMDEEKEDIPVIDLDAEGYISLFGNPEEDIKCDEDNNNDLTHCTRDTESEYFIATESFNALDADNYVLLNVGKEKNIVVSRVTAQNIVHSLTSEIQKYGLNHELWKWQNGDELKRVKAGIAELRSNLKGDRRFKVVPRKRINSRIGPKFVNYFTTKTVMDEGINI